MGVNKSSMWTQRVFSKEKAKATCSVCKKDFYRVAPKQKRCKACIREDA